MPAQIHPIVVDITAANVSLAGVPGIPGADLQAALDSVGTLLADQQEQIDAIEDALALPSGAVEVARVETDELFETAAIGLVTIPGLVLELDTTEMALQVDLYLAHLSSLMSAGGSIGLSITADGVSFENSTVTSPIAAPVSYGPVLLSAKIPQGSGAAVVVEGQILAVGGTAYVASDPTTRSFIRAVRL